VVKLQNASSYVCRNRYNGTNTLLSEHALANAFDVSQFVLANGTRISVLDHWPRVASKSEPNPALADNSAATNGKAKQKVGDRGRDIFTPAKAEGTTPPSPPPVAAEPESTSGDTGASSNPFVKPKGGDRGEDAAANADTASSAAPEDATEDDPVSDHARMSNPFETPKDRGEDAVTTAKIESTTSPPPPSLGTEPAPDARSEFVTYLFEDACRHFGTVLGPNANEAHKDHFHLDMKARRKSNFCE
jgi:hypothetical protein